MTRYDFEEKWDRAHWEDETITYVCENETLVVNSVKGVKTKSYSCKEGGKYNTPTGGVPWPQCTLSPTDPYIMTAIRLITDEYDRNIVHRQKLIIGGIFNTDAADPALLLLTYAIPCAACEF